jgi:hypothetical protein
MVQMGLVDPQKAMMAGMMIDRIQKQNMQAPQSTVAQDVLGLPATAPQQPQQQMQQPRPPSPGIEALPAGNVGNYAGGGIVAFAGGGDTIFDPLTGVPIAGEGSGSEYGFDERLGMIFDPNYKPYRAPTSRTAATTTTPPATQADVRRVGNTINPPAPAPAGRRTTPPFKPPAGGTAPTAGLTPPVIGPFDPNAVKIQGEEIPLPEMRERKAISAARRAAEIEEGVDPELYSKMIKGIEEKKGKLEKRKGEARGEALMMAGLGLMGAREGQEFQTLSESGIKALGAYKQDVKELRAAEEKYDERMDALRISDQQAKQTGARSDIAQAEKDRDAFNAARIEKAKAQNDLAKTSAQVSANVYGTKTQADVHMYDTAVRKDLGEKQLALQKQQIANQGAYYQKALAQNEARIRSMDAASQARYAQMKINAMKLLKDDQGYIDLQGQLRQKYKDTWQSNPEAQRLLQNYQAAFIGNMLDNQGALIGGARDAASLLQD